MTTPILASAAQLLHSIAFDIQSQPVNLQNEISTSTRFVEGLNDEALAELSEKGVSSRLLEGILKNRIGKQSWIASRPPTKWVHSLLRIMKTLLRDRTLIDTFHECKQHAGFVKTAEYLTKQYVTRECAPDYAQCIALVLNVVQKVCSGKEQVELFVINGMHSVCLQLLSTRDTGLLQGAIEVLGRLADYSSLCRCELCASNVIDTCLQLTPNTDILTQKLCVSLLRILSCEDQAREQIKIYDGVPMLVGFLCVKNSRLQWHVAWCLAQLTEDTETATEVAQLGGISLILTQLSTNKIPERGLGDWIAMLTGMCALLAQLCQSEANQLSVVSLNGIYVLGSLLLLPMKRQTDVAKVNEAAFQTLQCAILRVLRLLYSFERNRHFFKKALPLEIFVQFVDIGHFVPDLGAYLPLVSNYANLVKEKGTEELTSLWESVNVRKEPIGSVAEYDLLDQLGAGAFGCVYLVRKRSDNHSAHQHYALKEIFMNSMMSSSSSEHQKSVGDVISEVKIIRQQMRHPNIVRYRKVFVHNSKLYIVMDLIEGASLKEHIQSTKEKGEQFSEDTVWNIVIQMSMALRYLHKEKRIVHRDLKPSNIMIGDEERVVITDFGLAKERGADYLKSTAGTIVYSCPEIVQHLPYGEKADIWSFGCCIYEMCNLRPAFYSQNMLQLATLIVEGRYEAIEGPYSKNICDLVASCLQAEPENRPDIDKISSLIGPSLLLAFDQIYRSQMSTRKESTQTTRTAQGLLKSEPRDLSSSLNSSSTSAVGDGRKMTRRTSLSAGQIQKREDIPQERLPILPGLNIDKPKGQRRSSGKSLSAGTVGRGRGSLPLSTTLPNLPTKPVVSIKQYRSSLGVLQVRSSHKRSSSGPSQRSDPPAVTVRSGVLRPISDPVLQILKLIQNIHNIVESNPQDTSLNHKKRVVEQFQKRLFGRGMKPETSKQHLKKLSIESTEDIDLELGYADFRPVLNGIATPGYSTGRKIGRITYEQLAQCIQLMCGELKHTDSDWNTVSSLPVVDR